MAVVSWIGRQFDFEVDDLVDGDFFFLEADHEGFGLEGLEVIEDLRGSPLMVIPDFGDGREGVGLLGLVEEVVRLGVLRSGGSLDCINTC